MKKYGISEEIVNRILTKYIEPAYEGDVQQSLGLRNTFKRLGIGFEAASKIFVGVSSVLSFASGIYKNQVLSFVGGTTSVISLVFLQFASYSYKESKQSTEELNIILEKLNIEGVSDLNNVSKETVITINDSDPVSVNRGGGMFDATERMMASPCPPELETHNIKSKK